MRSIAFSTATLSWVTSIAVNLNPFMRFDGYYVLSDLTGIENLQQRGFALARWRLRELLFGIGDPPPETMPPNRRRLVVLHAWGTWVYRFFLFLGIALLVYGFLVKLIGIVLFVVEIAWFIALPVWRELVQWWQLRERIAASRRTIVTLGGLLMLVVLAVFPWSRNVGIPAILRMEGATSLHAPVPARLAGFDVTEGEPVQQGDILFRLDSPGLEDELLRVEAEMRLVSTRLARLTADVRDRSLRAVLETRAGYLREERSGLLRQKAALTILAPMMAGFPISIPHWRQACGSIRGTASPFCCRPSMVSALPEWKSLSVWRSGALSTKQGFTALKRGRAAGFCRTICSFRRFPLSCWKSSLCRLPG
ncbi:biotin/lipoyl-binding protein [Salaquimonas pukyongi]|uniref:biotin/lipoyl-binding protein n=1 Tax=Salaquimonas pukyongi TaxID=2712698 RepID=UPI0013BEA469|nr:biotin/lipoyl-binding protein [Salaquimonas pukyongi]